MQAARITCLDRRRRQRRRHRICSKRSPSTGHGRYYITDDPAAIPQIFAKETVTASKSAINEQPFVPQVVRPTQTLADIDLPNAPFLLGYVMTRPKPTCEVILASEKGDPLLVWWRYGLGMTVAFTSDAKSRWAAEWLTWPGYSQVLGAARSPHDAQERRQGRGRRGRAARRGRATLTLDADRSQPAASSTRPKPK